VTIPKPLLTPPCHLCLLRYRSFSVAEAGFHGAVIEDLAAKLRAGRTHIEEAAWHGGFAFDEMSHASGLIWSRTTGRLIGWTQTSIEVEREELEGLLEELDEVTSLPPSRIEAMLASHVLQVGVVAFDVLSDMVHITNYLIGCMPCDLLENRWQPRKSLRFSLKV
jgi:hypothetical protein